MTKILPDADRRKLLAGVLPSNFGTVAPLWIAGQWQDGEDIIPTVDPTTGGTIMDVAIAAGASIENAVTKAREAQTRWWTIDGQDRARILNRIAAAIRSKAGDLGLVDTIDAGRPVRDTLTRDPERAARTFEYFAGMTDRLRGATIPVQPGRSNRTEYEPYGIVGAIVPWNYPLTNAAIKLAPALATGNAVILKPAEQTPLSALVLASVAQQAGLPDGLLSVLNGPGGQTGTALVDHPEIGKIAFTGSTNTGREIASRAGVKLKSVTLELGGKTAFVVFPDADLDTAADALVFSMFNNAGQTCTAATRIIVHRNIRDSFVAKIKTRIEVLNFGDPLSPDTQIGPVISKAQYDKINAYVDNARARGLTEIELDKPPLPNQGYFLEPALFLEPGPTDALAQEEIFGPVGVVMSFDDDEEAVALANGTNYGLAVSIWSDSITRMNSLVPRMVAGLVWLNTVHSLHPGSPYGGYLQSGLGLEMGLEAIYQLMRVKSIWSDHGNWQSPWNAS